MTFPRRRSVAAFAALAAALLVVAPATSHGGREVDGYEFTVGFMNEPVYSGQSSGLELFVARDGAPIEGLEETLRAQVSFGDQTRDLELTPRFDEPGWYESVFFPTAAGRYTFRIHGTIEGTPVDETFTSGVDGFGDVAELATGQFPVQLPAPADVARDAAAGADAAGTATIGLVLGGAGLLVGLVALGVALAGRRRSP
ncbi:MAG TPA: hypothetical protein VFM19_02565 [Candidatus Limnocylindria bacterium]|nr:hypothetical protein [Candidatus Limnocylindria bacterium]